MILLLFLLLIAGLWICKHVEVARERKRFDAIMQAYVEQWNANPDNVVKISYEKAD